MKEILNLAMEAARDAGLFLSANFGKVSSIENKTDQSLATNLDKEAEKMIIAKIQSVFPGHGILAEESGKQNIRDDYLWIIDPLDGTHNFIRNINIFGVSIGILHKGKFVAGVVYMPVENEMYSAEVGSGAYKNGRRIKVSEADSLKECSISFDSSIRYSPDIMLRALGKLSGKVFNIRMLGSSVRQLSYLAEGKLDFCLEFHDRPWDFAGSVAIIREAGGMFCGLKGEEISSDSIGYIASAPGIYEELKKIVASFFV